jgi:uncharacterized membrane protein
MFGDDVNTSKLHSRKINGCLVPLGTTWVSAGVFAFFTCLSALRILNFNILIFQYSYYDYDDDDIYGDQYLDWRVRLVISVLVDCLKIALRCRKH